MNIKKYFEPIGVLATFVALVAGCLLVAWECWPIVGQWHRNRLANQLAQQLHSADDPQARVLIHQLASLGLVAFDDLMKSAASPRSEIARTARNEIDLSFAALKKRVPGEIDRKSGQAIVRLSLALANNSSQFGPDTSRWAEALALELIDLSDQLPASDATRVLAAGSRTLEVIPPQGPRDRTVGIDPEPPQTQAVKLPTAEVDLGALAVPSEQMLALKDPTSSRPEINVFSTEIPPSETFTEGPSSLTPTGPVIDSKVETLPWHSRGHSSLDVEVRDPPKGSGLSTIVTVPTPLQMKQRLIELRKLSTRSLIEKLPHADKFMAGTIRLVLSQRGMSEAEIELGGRLSATDVSERMDMIGEVVALPATSARRLLRLLLEDSNGDVRLRALTTLATTGDPQLGQLAQEIAVRDNDPRVAELATRLMQR